MVYLINVILDKEMDQNNVLNFFVYSTGSAPLRTEKIKTRRLTWYNDFQNTDPITLYLIQYFKHAL